MPQTWLEKKTGKPPAWWMAFVQREIAKASKKSKDPKHDTTDSKKWLGTLVRAVVDDLDVEGKYDGNLAAASILSQVLALWYLRCHRAKVLDPRRPLASRRSANGRWLEYAVALAELALDDRMDAAYFPGQRWQSPFDPDATSGDFV